MHFNTDINLYVASTITAAILTISLAAAKLSWWLSDQFKETRSLLFKVYDVHELKDQQRHEDNLVRFAKIETQLNTVLKNGIN